MRGGPEHHQAALHSSAVSDTSLEACHSFVVSPVLLWVEGFVTLYHYLGLAFELYTYCVVSIVLSQARVRAV